jgi:hypothetical protein
MNVLMFADMIVYGKDGLRRDLVSDCFPIFVSRVDVSESHIEGVSRLRIERL